MKRITPILAALATSLLLSATSYAAAPQADRKILSAQPRAQCAMRVTPKSAKATTAATQRRTRTQTTNIAFTSGRTQPSIHCCDANGQNCSGPVDILTICPVITVECKYTDNSCECTPV